MRDHYRMGHAPNYTNPFLVSFGVWLFCFFCVIGAVWGALAVMLTATGLDLLFQWIRPKTP